MADPTETTPNDQVLYRVRVTIEYDTCVMAKSDGEACLVAKQHLGDDIDNIDLAYNADFSARVMVEPDPDFDGCAPWGIDRADSRYVNDIARVQQEQDQKSREEFRRELLQERERRKKERLETVRGFIADPGKGGSDGSQGP